MIRNITIALFALFALNSCGSSKDEKDELSNSPQAIYKAAEGFMAEERYFKAAKEFEKIEAVFPFSPLAIKGQIRAAHSYYKDGKYAEAIEVLDRFTNYHTGNSEIPYALYLKGRCYYDRIVSVTRDQSITRDAKEAFTVLVNNHPESEYATDAKEKLKIINNQLAGKDMEVGRYYLSRKQYVGAANRFKSVLENYPKTPQVPEALYRLVEIYLLLGVKQEAKDFAAVLGHNYPASPWYKKAFELLK